MLRHPPTQISLSDREVLSLLHTIQLQRAALSLHLTIRESSLARQNEADESPFTALSSIRQTRSISTTAISSSSSFSPSSATEYSQSEYDRLANEVLRYYQEAKLYPNSSDGGNSSDETSPDPDLLAEYLAQSRPVFGSRATNLDGPVRINETSASSWRNNRVQRCITSNSTPRR